MKKIRAEIYSRICGYYRPVEAWNDGKREEFRLRAPFDLEKSMSHEVAKMKHQIQVFTVPNCPKCQKLKAKLVMACVKFDELDCSLPKNRLILIHLLICKTGQVPMPQVAVVDSDGTRLLEVEDGNERVKGIIEEIGKITEGDRHGGVCHLDL